MWIYDEPKICNSQILVAEQMKNTNKTSTWVYNTGAEHEVSDLIKLWQIAAGGEEALKKKPHVLGHVIANPPRVIDVNYTDWLIGFCDAGLPITAYSALMGGATGPATLAGMLVQAIAETLALVVQTQSYKPGHPLCFCSFNPAMDMRTGLWQFGNPEYGTVGAGISAMAKFYGIPCVGFTINDACDTDEQAAYESALKNYTYALSGISLIWDIGGMAGFNYVDWAHMCIENEVAGFIGHYLKGIRIDEERLSVDEILKVGPLPGSYLRETHTKKWYREEFFIPKLSNRDFFESWERGHTDLLEKGKQQALKILDSHESPVPSDVQKQIDEGKVLLEDEDVEIRELAKTELPVLRTQLEELETNLRLLLLPRDPNDERNVILEIRAGTGGEEACLFAEHTLSSDFADSGVIESRGYRQKNVQVFCRPDLAGLRWRVLGSHNARDWQVIPANGAIPFTGRALFPGGFSSASTRRSPP